MRLRNVARRLAELPVDGMIFNTNRTVEDFDEFKPVPGLPTIIISMKEHPRCTTIDSDQYGCSRMVVDYLRARGHAHIEAPRRTRGLDHGRLPACAAGPTPSTLPGLSGSSPCAAIGRRTRL